MAREKMHIDDDSLRDQKLSKAEIKRARRQEKKLKNSEFTTKPKWAKSNVSFTSNKRNGIKRKKRISRSLGGDIALALVLALFGAFSAYPLVYTIFAAFKPLNELFIYPPRLFVQNPTLDNFTDLIMLMEESWVPFSRYFFNTIFITLAGTVGHVIIASMAAYPLPNTSSRVRKSSLLWFCIPDVCASGNRNPKLYHLQHHRFNRQPLGNHYSGFLQFPGVISDETVYV